MTIQPSSQPQQIPTKPNAFVASVDPAPQQTQQTPAKADPTKPSNMKVIQTAPFQIQPIGKRDQHLKTLFYGKHGSGKTTLAATAVDVPQMRDVLYIDAERSETAIHDNPRISNVDLISQVQVASFKQVAYIHQFLNAHCKARDASDIDKLKKLEAQVTGVVPETPKRFRTAIVDSLTEIDQYSLYALRGVEESQMLEDPGDIDQVEWKGYGKNNEMIKMLVRAYRDLPMNILFLCSDQYTQNELKKYHYTPAMTGKLSTQVQGMVDIVGFLVVNALQDENDKLPRRLYIQPGEVGNARFDAKNRKSIYKKTYFDNPTMQLIMEQTGMLKR